jgi:hypothetical protein
MLWVTRTNVGLDRVACAWLIQKWIDPQAEIWYVTDDVLPGAIHAGALPFHNTTAEEASWEERTSFSQLLAEYKLDQADPALVRLAGILQAAERDPDLSQREAAQLVARLREIKAQARTDAEVVTQMSPVLDALYTEAQRSAMR